MELECGFCSSCLVSSPAESQCFLWVVRSGRSMWKPLVQVTWFLCCSGARGEGVETSGLWGAARCTLLSDRPLASGRISPGLEPRPRIPVPQLGPCGGTSRLEVWGWQQRPLSGDERIALSLSTSSPVASWVFMPPQGKENLPQVQPRAWRLPVQVV